MLSNDWECREVSQVSPFSITFRVILAKNQVKSRLPAKWQIDRKLQVSLKF